VGAPLLVVTPWYPLRATGTPLETGIARTVAAAAHAGADVSVVHVVPAGTDASLTDPAARPAGAQHVPVRRVAVDGEEVDALVAALRGQAGDLLGAAAVVHAHGGLPVAVAAAAVLPDGARLVVGEHLDSLAPLLAGPDEAGGASGSVVDAYAPVLERAEVVLLPSEALARAFTRRFGGEGRALPRIEVLPYLPPAHLPAAPLQPMQARSPAGHSDADEPGTLPLVRWLLLGNVDGAETVVRALAADALAGAATTLAVIGNGDVVKALAARLGVGDRVSACPAEQVLDRLARGPGITGWDLVVDLDPLSAADPALPAVFAAGLPAVLGRAAGPEEVVDEVASAGGVRLLPPGRSTSPSVVTLLEAIADLRQAGPLPAQGTALPPWWGSLDGGARRLARHYGEAVAPPGGPAAGSPSPRVLLVDLAGSHRGAIGRLGRWVTGVGGEPVVVTAAAPPPCSAVPGAITIDLRPVERSLARPPLGGVRRRLPAPARSGFDSVLRLYRALRPPPTLVQAALAGPLADGTPSEPRFDAVVATDPAGAELGRRWTGARDVLPPDGDALVRALLAASTTTAARAGTSDGGGSERS
jgi:hypothetical protein